MMSNTLRNVSGRTSRVPVIYYSSILFLSANSWWTTWWVYFSFVAVFLIFLFLVRRYELNRIKLKNQLQLEKIETDSLRSMVRIKSRFFTNISHEFRTPLTLILGQVESVLASGIDTKDKAKLEVAGRNARRLQTLINQILDLAKLEAGSMKLHASEFNIVPFLKGLFYSFESLAASKKISLLFDSDSEIIPVVFDPDKMEMVIYNLVSNAVKFTRTNGVVKVSIHSSDPQFVEIQIENEGRSIPGDQLPYIFNRFYQADSSGTRQPESTGIGLALAREIVELHRGTISVDSIEGASTIFKVRLPVKGIISDPDRHDDHVASDELTAYYYTDHEIDSSEIELSRQPELSSENREIILVIEDNKEVCDFIREQLEADYFVMEAENGKMGITVAREALPDLIITDLMMPVMDGLQFCKEIREDVRTSHIPVIMLTAKAGSEDKIVGLETGIDDYITKPFSTKELKVRVRNLISQRRLLRTQFSLATLIKPSEINATSIDKLFLEKLITAIEANFENKDFTIESLASVVSMSVSQLNRKLNALISQPAGQLMRSMRLQRAAELLEKNAGTVAQICFQLGFNDQAYFSRAFRKQFGCSPGEYRKG